MPNKKRTIELDEDIAFQHKEWMWQRVGIVALALLVLGALLGLTGVGGPLSRGEAGDPAGAVHVEYERLVRRGAMVTVTLHLRAESPGPTRFWVSAPYFDHVTVESVVPTPEVVSAEPSRLVYSIAAGGSPVAVKLHLKHTTVARVEAEIGLVGGPSVRFDQISLF